MINKNLLIYLIIATIITTNVFIILYKYIQKENNKNIIITILDNNNNELEQIILKNKNLKSGMYSKVLVYSVNNKTISYTGNYKIEIDD